MSIFILAGPTASGKSSLALEIAAKMNAVIINADSKQIYREIPIITAQPSKEEQALVPHLLYGYRSITEQNSMTDWLEDAALAIKQCQEQGKTLLLVGGTGMYIKALLEGYAPIPDIEPGLRAKVRALCEEIGPELFHVKLKEHDPQAAAQIKPGDTQRLIRAYEVMEQTGRSIYDWHKERISPPYPRKMYRIFFLDPGREQIYQNVDKRFDQMIQHGVLEEIKAIRNILSATSAAKSHGIPELCAYLDGTMSLEEAIAKAKQNTRNYVKRQYTWFNHQIEGLEKGTKPEWC